MTRAITTRVPRRTPRHPTWLVFGWELEKLTAQLRARLVVVAAVMGPALIAVALRVSTDVPADTLFGRWVGDSGYAVCLLILGFAAAYGIPLLVSLVAGDIFAAEDHHRTWPTLLTRSVTRRSIFAGKVIAALTVSTVIVVLLALAALLAGLFSVGHQGLIGLSGNMIDSGRAAGLVIVAWLSLLPTAWSLTALGILVSIATRSSIAGILAPTVLGLLMQLTQYVGGPIDTVRYALPGASFGAWVGLFADPGFHGPFWLAIGSAMAYLVVFLGLGWVLFRRRDVLG